MSFATQFALPCLLLTIVGFGALALAMSPSPLAIVDGELKKAAPEAVRDPQDAALVYETARQMFYEEHVRLLWVMYNSFSTTAGDPSSSSDAGPNGDEPALRLPAPPGPARTGETATATN
jgi:hypothetical protein